MNPTYVPEDYVPIADGARIIEDNRKRADKRREKILGNLDGLLCDCDPLHGRTCMWHLRGRNFVAANLR